MSFVMEAIDNLLDIFVDDRVKRDVVSPIFELGLVGQLAVKNQIGSLQISAFFGNLLDRIAAVAKNAAIAINISDLALARRRIHESRIVTDEPFVLRDPDLE